ncbi:MAG: VWA domain-containing protein [Candidatus Korobacteraceae bacterium]|jgi:tetratricopeptide (TPR) repeat protein
MSTGNSLGSISTQSGFALFGRHVRLSLRALIASVFCLAGAVALQPEALAELADKTGLSAYEAALKETGVARQIPALEHFLNIAGNGPLTTSAIEFLVWDYLQTGAPVQAARPAKALLAIDSGNAIALAALVDPRVGGSPGDARERFRMATRGLAEFGHLQKPVGMTREEFFRVQMQILSTLEGEAGFGYLGQKDYAAAQQYLQQAVATVPNNGRYVYGLAIAMLKQKPPQNQGYWYLARAVNLSRGTPQGAQIAEFARKQYVDAGGSNSNWDRFLIAAMAPTSATKPNIARSTAPLSSRPDQARRAAAPRPPDSHAAPVAKPSGQVQSASIAVATPSASKARTGPTAVPVLPPSQEPAQNTAKAGLQFPPVHKRAFVPRDGPLSLGIVIQKARLTHDDRDAILFALSDLVRHLRQDDEVFVMGFSNELEFEQDLTRNEKLLEEAIAGIKPQSGAALLDAVAFAAGHLDRIAKNRSRVLLVISDGRDAAAHVGSSEINAVLGRVRVDCIGLDVDDVAGMNLLQSLASYSGGQTSFAAGPKQFRAATWEFAKSMGIEFPY